ncbi:MAG TPA: transcriptional regulator [Capsulimonadaceae bacterium]|nr:transcriptional regulator [Capsulimonadaceae bacterium]
MNETERRQFGAFLKRLRMEKRLSLRQVEAEVGISNSYLYQVESGRKNPPKVDVLRKMAALYGVSLDAILSAANLGEPEKADLYDDRLVENAFEFVRKDPEFESGTYMTSNTLPIEAKRFIVEMYEKMTGRRLLSPLKKEE